MDVHRYALLLERRILKCWQPIFLRYVVDEWRRASAKGDTPEHCQKEFQERMRSIGSWPEERINLFCCHPKFSGGDNDDDRMEKIIVPWVQSQLHIVRKARHEMEGNFLTNSTNSTNYKKGLETPYQVYTTQKGWFIRNRCLVSNQKLFTLPHSILSHLAFRIFHQCDLLNIKVSNAAGSNRYQRLSTMVDDCIRQELEYLVPLTWRREEDVVGVVVEKKKSVEVSPPKMVERDDFLLQSDDDSDDNDIKKDENDIKKDENENENENDYSDDDSEKHYSSSHEWGGGGGRRQQQNRKIIAHRDLESPHSPARHHRENYETSPRENYEGVEI